MDDVAKARIAALERELLWAKTMLHIRQRDAVDLEQLMRSECLPDLPPRQGREVQLSGLIGTSICEGLYIIDNLHKALNAVPGEVCEFGVAQGATSALLAAEIMGTHRSFYLFDSFEGLPAPTAEDVLLHDIFNLGTMSAYEGQMASPESEVIGRLDELGFPIGRRRIRKGWIKETVRSGDLPQKIAFAYVDFDFYEPIRDALDFVDSRSEAGARIVVDDYGVFSSGAKTAADEFLINSQGAWKIFFPRSPAGGFVCFVKVTCP